MECETKTLFLVSTHLPLPWPISSHLCYWGPQTRNAPSLMMLRKETLLNDAFLKAQNESDPPSKSKNTLFSCLSQPSKPFPFPPLHGCKFPLRAHTWMHWCVQRQIPQVPRIQNEMGLCSNNTHHLTMLIFKCTQTKSSAPFKSQENGLGTCIFNLTWGQQQRDKILSLFQISQ
jgi:hypothetical protein